MLFTGPPRRCRGAGGHCYDVKPVGDEGHGGSDARICRDFLEYDLDGKPPVSPAVAERFSVAVGCQGAESIRRDGVPLEVPPLPEDPAGLQAG